jgi:hypothetical protein
MIWKSESGLHKQVYGGKIQKRTDKKKCNTSSSPTNAVCGCHPDVFAFFYSLKYGVLIKMCHLALPPA